MPAFVVAAIVGVLFFLGYRYYFRDAGRVSHQRTVADPVPGHQLLPPDADRRAVTARRPVTSAVVTVRAARTVFGGGGCCSGDVRPFDDGGSHDHVPVADEVAELYRALPVRLPPDVAVEVVSPSNWLWLLPVLVGDGRRRGLRGPELRRSVRAGLAVSSLVADGRVLSSGRLPTPEAAVAAVEAELALL